MPSMVARTRRFPVVAEDCGYETPCWIWQGAVSTAGYGTRGKPGFLPVKLVQTHKEMFELAFGEIPGGEILHHLCEQKRCCNPNHMATMTRAEHVRLHEIWRHSPMCQPGPRLGRSPA